MRDTLPADRHQAAAPIRLLALDVDGTLVNSRDELTEPTRRALARASAAGVKLVLATGRRYSRALPLVEPFGSDTPLVVHSGALVKRPADHATLFAAQFAPGLLRAVVDAVELAGFETLLYGDTFAAGHDFYCRHERALEPYLDEYLRLNPGCGRLWPAWHATLPSDIFAAFALGSRNAMLALAHTLTEQFVGQLETAVLRSPFYAGTMCEIAPAGVTKWSAILQLARAWGIAADEICAVGDDVNDLPMIAGAGLGVAMGNAPAAVQRAAHRIAPTHDEDGLVTVVRWILEGGD